MLLRLNCCRCLRYSTNGSSVRRPLAIPFSDNELFNKSHVNNCKSLQGSNGKYQREIATLLNTNYNGAIMKRTSMAAMAAASTTDVGNPGFIASIYQSISESIPIAYLQQTLVYVHDSSGLPWWASIILSTILFRSLVTLPLIIYQYKIVARLQNLKFEMSAIVNELKKEATLAMKQLKLTEEQTRLLYNRSLKKQWTQLIVRDNCHPAKTFIVLWAQIPLWIGLSMAIRNLVYMLPNPTAIEAQIAFAELTLGGFGWIPNLTQVDASFILPVVLGIINLAIIEMQMMLRVGEPTRLQNVMTNLFRSFSIVMVPVACAVPSALVLYWVTSSSYSLLQNLLLVSPRIRRTLRIPQTEHELATPYKRLWQRLRQRLHLPSK